LSKQRSRSPVPSRHDDRAGHTENHTIVQHSAQWSGPLPHPADLREFNEIVPNGATRIFDQFEKEGDHRRAIERQQANFVVRDTHIGQFLAGMFATLGLGVAAFAIYMGAEWAGTVIGGGIITPIVIAFLRQSSGKK
jgi:uncharacterized membrane protein